MHATAEFALTRDDFLRLQRVTARRVRGSAPQGLATLSAKVTLWMLTAAALFICFKMADAHPADATVLYTMAGVVVAAITLAGVMPYAGARDRRQLLIADAGSFLRPHSLQVSEDGLHATWRTGRSEMAWSEFLARDGDDVNHYLFVDSCSAVVVPRRVVAAFQSDFERLIQAIPAG